MPSEQPKPESEARHGGRIPKLTPETQSSICTDIADGIDQKHAALRAGVTQQTVNTWLRKGRAAVKKLKQSESDLLYSSFLSAYQKAVADAVAANVQLIQIVAREGTWQAAAWWLERRHPDLYGSDRKRVKELERLLAEIIKGGASGAGATPPRRTTAPAKGGKG